MRIWNCIAPNLLCRKHLLGEHRELHAIFAILTKDSAGYANHPEVKRWRDPQALAPWIAAIAPPPWDDQLAKLRAKECDCVV